MTRERFLAPLVACGATLVLTALLFWPLPLELATSQPDSAFTGGQTWGMSHIARMLVGDLPLSTRTLHLGFPQETKAQFLGWVPALIATPLQPLLGPIASFNILLLISPVFATAAAYVWLRKSTAAERWTAALGALLYASCPYLLSNIASCNLDKIQIWFYPAWLALAWWMLSSRRGWWALPVFTLLGSAMVFTEPYPALFLPLFAGPLLLGRAVLERSWRVAVRSLAALASTGLGMLPAHAYYTRGSIHDRNMLFEPAAVLRHQTPPALQEPVATFENLLFGPGGGVPEPTDNVHACTIGLALLVAVLLLCWRPARGRGTGLALTLLGLVIALGPQLMVGGQWRLEPLTQHPFYLPMELLERAGYPLVLGGQYYRAAPVVFLGVVTLLCAGLSLRSPRIRLAAWSLVPLSLAQGLWTTGPHWPHPIRPIASLPLLEQLAELGEISDGVVVLPLAVDQVEYGRRASAAAVYRHPSTVVLRHILLPEMMGHFPWAIALQEDGVVVYRQEGFRYALFYKHDVSNTDPHWLGYEAHAGMLGEPILEDEEIAVFEIR